MLPFTVVHHVAVIASSLEKARAYAASMAGVLRDWTPDKMAYLP